VERRHLTFIAVSLAIILAFQALQAWLFPEPRRADPAPAGAAAGERRPDADLPVAAEDSSADSAPEIAAGPADDRPRERRTLGSLDPTGAARMLVTLTSRGAAVERIELADDRLHDQDDRGGYIGHLAATAGAAGCRLGVVGPGTPAHAAGLRAGDEITRLDGLATPDPRTLHDLLAATRPGQQLAVEYLRAGERSGCQLTAGRRPLEVVRPERLAEPVASADDDPHDPLSFLLTIENRDGRSRRDPAAELRGQELADIDWTVGETADGAGVRFSRAVADGLTVVKEYRIAPPPAGAAATGHRLALSIELVSAERDTVVAYALDGPTGLPTEGWWYAQRVGPEIFSGLAVRDVVLRFAGGESTLVSGLKIADGTLEHPASAILEGRPLSFAGVDSLYFAAALVPALEGAEVPLLAEVRPRAVGRVPEGARRKLVDVTPRLVSQPLALAPGAPVIHRYEIFAGPKRPELLREFGRPEARMDDIVYYGWFGWVARPLTMILHGLNSLVGNYGIAIILLTVIVRGGMFPMSRKQALASQKMQALQPEMKAIAERYKSDPEKRTRATQELWRKHHYNPMGGCLPVLIQFPIFIGLYRALATDVELRQAALFSPALRWCSNLAAPDMLLDWSGWLPAFLVSPEGWLGPFLNLFPLATIGLFLWQQKLFMPPAVDEQQRMQQQVMNFMMWFMALMFFKVPCGLCLYFIASSLWGIGERVLLPTGSHPAAVAAAGNGAVRVVDARAEPVKGAGAADAVRQKRQARRRPGLGDGRRAT